MDYTSTCSAISFMGMDVFGRKPIGKSGEYFRANIWWWHPLWTYCEDVANDLAPGLIPDDSMGHSNDGWGLGTRDSKRLAKLLRDQLASGATATYEAKRNAHLAAIPDERCEICGGTGKRLEPPNVGPGDLPCNACDSKGTRRPYHADSPFSAAFVADFATFLEQCGGFEIC